MPTHRRSAILQRAESLLRTVCMPRRAAVFRLRGFRPRALLFGVAARYSSPVYHSLAARAPSRIASIARLSSEVRSTEKTPECGSVLEPRRFIAGGQEGAAFGKGRAGCK